MGLDSDDLYQLKHVGMHTTINTILGTRNWRAIEKVYPIASVDNN